MKKMKKPVTRPVNKGWANFKSSQRGQGAHGKGKKPEPALNLEEELEEEALERWDAERKLDPAMDPD